MKSCWNCSHRPVCKFWAAVAENHFPFADDSKIKPFMSNTAPILAEACAWYADRQGEPKDQR